MVLPPRFTAGVVVEVYRASMPTASLSRTGPSTKPFGRKVVAGADVKDDRLSSNTTTRGGQNDRGFKVAAESACACARTREAGREGDMHERREIGCPGAHWTARLASDPCPRPHFLHRGLSLPRLFALLPNSLHRPCESKNPRSWRLTLWGSGSAIGSNDRGGAAIMCRQTIENVPTDHTMAAQGHSVTAPAERFTSSDSTVP
jgi:hypothetical protein